ncbi:hypothetical protein AAZR23_08365 [Morganella sp. Je.2.23]|uniref:hypothetical protein n=1 Tax=Morganella sp. Je.2.23 TaxID=3142840 RepID=UPI003DA7AEC2
MKINYDLIHDWHELLRDVLKNKYGFDDTAINSLSEEDLSFKVIYFEERNIISKPRTIYESFVFNCPPDMLDGWNKLKKSIANGDNLTPYLSKGINNLDYQDKMLNEWGIHHFHLGVNMSGGFIERTGPLLFAFVTEQDFYAINIYKHNDWAEQTILQIIHDNWPQLISGYKVSNGIKTSETITPAQRISLREVNANSCFTVADGTVYMPTGGGSMSSGYNLSTTLKVIKTRNYINSIGEILDSPPEELKKGLLSSGYSECDDIDARLIISNTGYSVYFPQNKLLLNIAHPKA